MEVQISQRHKKTVWQRMHAFIITPLSHAMRRGLLVCLILAFTFGGVGIFTLLRHDGVFTALVTLFIVALAGLVLTIILTLFFVAIKRLS
ncbi:MAG: hypothetical protein FWD05_07375 [Oscillospiraceae bacterium]|nr:hypothetical protein [Oscillospiraceae bacterium]